MSQGVQFMLKSLVIFLFGLGMFLLGGLSGKKRRDILRNGEEAVGTVSSIRKCFDDNRYQFQITYQTKKGKTVTGNWDEFHSLPFCKQHPVGSTFRIVYLPERPTKFVVKDFSSMNIAFVFMKIFGIVIILFSFFIFSQVFKNM